MSDTVEPTPERIAQAERAGMVVKGDGRYRLKRRIYSTQLERLAFVLGTIDVQQYNAGLRLQALHEGWSSQRITPSYALEAACTTPLSQSCRNVHQPERRELAMEQYLEAPRIIDHDKQWEAVRMLCVEDLMLITIGTKLGYGSRVSAQNNGRKLVLSGLKKLAVAWGFEGRSVR